MANYHVVVKRELADHDRAVLEARSYEIVAKFGPSIVATGEPPIPADAWREVKDSTGFVVDVTADSASAAIESVRTALGADDVTIWRAYPVTA